MNIGIIGSGFMGKTHIECYKNCGVKNLFICDTNLSNAQKLATEYGGKAFSSFDELLNTVKLDAVSVCVPTPLHEPLALKALERGVAVLCEKPFAATVEAANRLVEKAKETKTPLMVAHCLRFMKPYICLKQAIKDGRYGAILSLNMYRHSTMPLWSEGSWLANMEKSGGAVVDLHIHETDMAVFLFGVPRAVTTVGDYKQCSTVYLYNGVGVSAQASWRKIANYPFTSGFDANFENATLRFDGNGLFLLDGKGEYNDLLQKENYPEFVKSDNAYENEIRYFLSGLKTGEFDYCPTSESVMSTKTAYAELQSVKSGKTIEIK